MVSGGGARIGWEDLPREVQGGVERILGSQVIASTSQPGGFSPGSADRVVLASGTRAFVKAVSEQQNPASVGIHRREAATAASLPAGLPAPTFLGAFDNGTWVALCFSDVAGRHPHTPWVEIEIDSVLAALARLAAFPVDVNRLPNPPAAVSLAPEFAGWERIAEKPPIGLPSLVTGHLDELRALAARSPQVMQGGALCHLDIRADNLLIDATGQVLIVDWPWAASGAPWIDSVAMLANVGSHGGHDLEALVARTPVIADTDPAAVNAFLAGLAAYFIDTSRQPDPPGLPTLRAFQRQQGDAVLAWLAVRLGWT